MAAISMDSGDDTPKIDDSLYRKRIRAWAMYDWANSAFATTILAALLPPILVPLQAQHCHQQQQQQAIGL